MKKKLVVFNDFPIFPVVHGGKVRILNIYKNLSSHFQVTYISYGDSETVCSVKRAEDFLEINVPKNYLYINSVRLGKWLLKNSIDDIVAMLFSSSNRLLKKTIFHNIRESEIIVFCHPYMYPAARRYITDQIVVYEALNVEYSLKRSILGTGFLQEVILKHLNNTEGELVRRCSICFAMSPEDKAELIRLYDADPSKIFISPNGVDPDFYNIPNMKGPLRRERIIQRPLILFLGSGHPPNVEAARQILHSIAPRCPEMYFLIAGSVCWVIQHERTRKNVGLAYYLTDVEKQELLLSADIAINPMISGSGTNLKMLDYMAAGLPVISTPVGARGIALRNYTDAIICGVEAFPDELGHLIEDASFSEMISRNGRNLVNDCYDWKKIATTMTEDILNTFGSKGM